MYESRSFRSLSTSSCQIASQHIFSHKYQVINHNVCLNNSINITEVPKCQYQNLYSTISSLLISKDLWLLKAWKTTDNGHLHASHQYESSIWHLWAPFHMRCKSALDNWLFSSFRLGTSHSVTQGAAQKKKKTHVTTANQFCSLRSVL